MPSSLSPTASLAYDVDASIPHRSPRVADDALTIPRRHAMTDADALGEWLKGRGRRLSVAFVTCSYDTGFESVASQVAAKVGELVNVFGVDGPVRWSLWIVDDLPSADGFSARVEEGFRRCPPALNRDGRLRCIPMTTLAAPEGGLKGQAILDGMRAALVEQPDALVYINLNLKVSATLAATGLRTMVRGPWDVCVGSRACVDGGRTVGAGAKGRLKSKGYNLLVRRALPPLERYKDTNAPMKILSTAAARFLVESARITTVTFDAEWLLLLEHFGFGITLFPVTWTQRPGSKPPWHLILACALDVWRIRRRWRRERISALRRT